MLKAKKVLKKLRKYCKRCESMLEAKKEDEKV